MSPPIHFTTRPDLHSDPNIKHVRELVRSNDGPPSSLPSTMAAVSGELALYDDEIARLRAELNQVEADRGVLQAHYDDCSGLLCRRFEGRPPSYKRRFGQDEPEMHILAQSPLLVIAHVCSRWHSLVMGTPTFWNRIEVGEIVSFQSQVQALLHAALERSGKAPLNISVIRTGSIIETLAQHSERWKTAKFQYVDVPYLSSVKARLPLLETLTFTSSPLQLLQSLDCFEIAPQLRNLIICGSLLYRMATPLGQLRYLTCTEVQTHHLAKIVSMLSQLSHSTHCRIEMWLTDHSMPPRIHNLALPSTSSSIATLSFDFAGYFEQPFYLDLIAQIFASLTVPHLREFTLESSQYSRKPLLWPQILFLSVAERSSFHAHLLTLDIYHVLIPEADLLECLHALPKLEHLKVSDHADCTEYSEKIRGLLITDDLLRSLSDSRHLVPRLHYLGLRSFLQFEASVFLDFLRARNRPGPAFECALQGFAGKYRELDPAVVAHIEELRINNELVFSFAVSDY
ncbi:hypothetical protein C8R43DRAFT_994259 [Mycena crocata]|nr:hypothetical protein C8R43DRAFT_994259 [Mycena crocata]